MLFFIHKIFMHNPFIYIYIYMIYIYIYIIYIYEQSKTLDKSFFLLYDMIIKRINIFVSFLL